MDLSEQVAGLGRQGSHTARWDGQPPGPLHGATGQACGSGMSPVQHPAVSTGILAVSAASNFQRRRDAGSPRWCQQ
jgi:hypothetical protein